MSMTKKILVVGDLAIDRYYKGKISGISPEGPYPIVMNPAPTHNLGCAANVARNIKGMFPKISVDMMAVIGHDPMGKKAKQLLEAANVGIGLVFKLGVTTITKNRLVGDNVVLARWDEELEDNVTNKLKLIQKMAEIAKEYDVIVFSDYSKGMVFQQLVVTAKLNKNPDAVILVDPKKHFSHYVGVDLIKPNMKELRDFGHVSGDSIELLKARCLDVIRKLKIKNMLLTMSEDGMLLVSEDGSSKLFPTKALDIVDITGCGDTVISAVAGCMALGQTLDKSIQTANVAAGVNAGKFGTYSVTSEDIKNA